MDANDKCRCKCKGDNLVPFLFSDKKYKIGQLVFVPQRFTFTIIHFDTINEYYGVLKKTLKFVP